MDDNLLSDISSDENDKLETCTHRVFNDLEAAIDLTPSSSLSASPSEPNHFDDVQLLTNKEIANHTKSISNAEPAVSLLKEISSDEDEPPVDDGRTNEMEKNLKQSEEVSEDDKKRKTCLWVGESTKWQRITASDFENFRELSDTDDEFDDSAQTVADTKFWSQSIVPTKYYVRTTVGGQLGTGALNQLQTDFEEKVLQRIGQIRDAQPKSGLLPEPKFHSCSHSCNNEHDETSSSSSSDDSDRENNDGSSSDNNSSSSSSDLELSEFNKFFEGRRTMKSSPRKKMSAKKKKQQQALAHNYRPSKQALMAKFEIERKQSHPAGLHKELCFNEPGQLNDGPSCRCSWASRRTGVRHNKFAGEKPIPRCNLNASNIDRLYHYVLRVEPNPSGFTRDATHILANGFRYEFDGFSVFFHQPLPDAFPQRPMNQWTNDFTAKFEKENSPESFTVKDLELFYEYVFEDILEMYDVDRAPNNSEDQSSCPFFHCMPRFARILEDDGKEILPMSSVLKHFTEVFVPFADDSSAQSFYQDMGALLDVARDRKGALFINPAKKPMCVRVDLIDQYDLANGHDDFYPIFTHFGVRPSAYTYSGRPEYQRALKRLVKLRHILSLKSQLNTEDRQKLRHGEAKLARLRAECKSKRDIQARLNSRGFFETGFFPDVTYHALLLISMCSHARFHWSLRVYQEERLKYTFQNKILLELALTHPSYRANYGTNADHAKNALNNCGIIQTKIRGAVNALNGVSLNANDGSSSTATRKRGIAALMEIMAMQCSQKANKSASSVNHNERLEFLGDAVVEFITTVHLFFMFPELEEGGLATYRSALVQNKHLASLAKKIRLHEFMLYAHGPDLCHEADLRHAMANAFEAMMAAIFLDSNINECDRIFSDTLYSEDDQLSKIWKDLPEHPLKVAHPFGDRYLIDVVPCLKKLTEFEHSVGIRFKHIRLLAKAFTRRNICFNYLTLGHNQRLEFLGDTVLQLITTDYLYRHFPQHQEGHLSLLRTCLVSNKTQSVICDDLAIQQYLVIPKSMGRSKKTNSVLRVKDKADLVESFLGALYVDRGLQYCKVFCRVCFFPRLKYFILTQRWNDPKSQLQQCCLTLRPADSADPDIPEYKTIGAEGPTNTRVYRVAVYFRNKRLAEGVGSSVQLAQMQAAENALIEKAELFPSFDFRKTYLGANMPDDDGGEKASSAALKRKRKINSTSGNAANNNKRQRLGQDRSSKAIYGMKKMSKNVLPIKRLLLGQKLVKNAKDHRKKLDEDANFNCATKNDETSFAKRSGANMLVNREHLASYVRGASVFNNCSSNNVNNNNFRKSPAMSDYTDASPSNSRAAATSSTTSYYVPAEKPASALLQNAVGKPSLIGRTPYLQQQSQQQRNASQNALQEQHHSFYNNLNNSRAQILYNNANTNAFRVGKVFNNFTHGAETQKFNAESRKVFSYQVNGPRLHVAPSGASNFTKSPPSLSNAISGVNSPNIAAGAIRPTQTSNGNIFNSQRGIRSATQAKNFSVRSPANFNVPPPANFNVPPPTNFSVRPPLGNFAIRPPGNFNVRPSGNYRASNPNYKPTNSGAFHRPPMNHANTNGQEPPMRFF